MTPDAELNLTLDIAQDVTVVTCNLVEGISKLTHACLEVASTTHLSLDGVLEKDAVIDLSPVGFLERRWTLRVGHVDFTKITEGSLRYLVNLYPAFWLLRFTTNTRKFRSMSAQQIISQILGEHAIAHRFELIRQTDTRKYCAQYRETNLDFILRLLEFEGIYYFFEQDGTLVFADHSPDNEAIDGVSLFELQEAEGAMQWGNVGIYAFKKGRRVASGKATVNDFNWKKPKVPLLKDAAAAEDAELEIYDYPVGYRREDQGVRIAKLRLEALRVPATYAEGSGNVTSFAPARGFTFGSLASARFAGEYLLCDIEHDYVNRKFEEHAGGVESDVNYRNHWQAIPKSVPFRPPLVTAQPHIAGCHSAMVRGPEGEEIHTDVHGRYRAQFHWDREAVGSDEDSRWLRNTQEVATGMVLARVGWEQSIAYVNGDPDRPFGFARQINGQMTPEYGQPFNKTRTTVKTPTYPGGGGFNELRMEDLLGSQHMDWHGERDMMNQIGNDRSEHVGGNENKKIGNSFSWTVGNDQQIDIGGNFKVGVGDKYSFNVDADRTKKVTGNEEIKVTAVYAYQVEGNDKEEVTGDRKVEAAEKSGSITRAVNNDLNRWVQGDWQAEGPGNYEIIVQDDLTESVAHSKSVKVNNGGIGLRVGGKYNMTVGQLTSRKSAQSMGYSSQNANVTVMGSATFHGKENIAVNSKEIVLDADSSILLESKGLSIELTPTLTTIKGAMKIDALGDITVKGNIDNLTK